MSDTDTNPDPGAALRGNPLAGAIAGKVTDNMADPPAKPDPDNPDNPNPKDSDWMFGKPDPDAADPNADPDPNKPDPDDSKPDPNKPAAPDSIEAIQKLLQDGAVDAVVKHLMPDVPEFLAQGDKAQIDSWQKMRDTLSQSANKVASLQLQLQKRPTPDGKNLPETEAVAQLTARIQELEPAASKWQEIEARNQIADSPAFREKFDRTRADIVSELTAAARKSGAENPEALAEEFLTLGTGIDMTEWVDGQFQAAEDATDEQKSAIERFKGFFTAQGEKFRSLTKEAQAEIEAPNPIERLKDYREYEAAFGTRMAVKMSDGIKAQFQAAVPRARTSLMASDPEFFQTEPGVAALDGIAKRMADGGGVGPDEVVEALAQGPRADAYRALAGDLMKQITALESRLIELGDLDPGRDVLFGSAPPAKGGDNPNPTNMPEFGTGAPSVEPLVTPEQMAAALKR